MGGLHKQLVSHLPNLISVILLIAVIALKFSHAPLITHIQLKIFDFFQQQSPRTYTEQPVKIIDIDDESLQKIGQWPWPRTTVAALLAKLHEAGSAAVVMDIVLAEPDRTSPKQLQSIWPDTQNVQQLIRQLPDHDQLLAETIRQGNVVTGFVLTEHGTGKLPQPKAGYVFSGSSPYEYLLPFKGAVTSLPSFEHAASGNGALNSAPDDDGILRKVPLLYRIGEKLYPSLTMEALRTAQGASSYIVKSVGGSGEEGFGKNTGITHIKIGELVVPTTADGQLWVYYSKYKHARYVPAWKVLQGNVDKATLEGSITLIGTSAAGLKDIRATPLSPVTSGVEVHAQAIEQILTGEFLYRPDWLEGAEVLLMAIAGLILIYLVAKVSALWQAVFTCAVLIATGTLSWYAYQELHYLIDPVIPGLGIALVYLSESLRTFLVSEKERKQIRNAFSHYMSPVLVEQLAANPDQLKLGGEMKELTVLFSDIRGFTTISEQLDAQGLTRFMNRFLTPVSDVILKHNGTIDKYIGDCVMAFWNAPLDNPNHVSDACTAALGMLKAVKQFNEEQEKLAQRDGTKFIPVHIGIGLNTGDCCVGNMGSEQRFDYSVLGDDVNLASRLEGQTKYYGVDILLGETTKAYAKDFAVLELDCLQVKGKTKPVHIYALLGDKSLAETQGFKQLVKAVDAFHQAYRNKQWEDAKAKLLQCVELAISVDENLPLDTMAKLFSQRIDHFLANPPEAEWNGVFVAQSK